MKTEKTTPKKIWFCNAVRSVLALALIASSLTFSADAEAATRRKGGRKSSAKVTAVSKSSKKSNKSKSTDRIVKTIAALISEATPAPISTSAPAVAKTEAEFFKITPAEVKELFPTTGDDIVGTPQFKMNKADTENAQMDLCTSELGYGPCTEESATGVEVQPTPIVRCGTESSSEDEVIVVDLPDMGQADDGVLLSEDEQVPTIEISTNPARQIIDEVTALCANAHDAANCLRIATDALNSGDGATCQALTGDIDPIAAVQEGETTFVVYQEPNPNPTPKPTVTPKGPSMPADVTLTDKEILDEVNKKVCGYLFKLNGVPPQKWNDGKPKPGDQDGDGVPDQVDNSSYNGHGKQSRYTTIGCLTAGPRKGLYNCEFFTYFWRLAFMATCGKDGGECWCVGQQVHKTILFRYKGRFFKVEPQGGSAYFIQPIKLDPSDIVRLPAPGKEGSVDGVRYYNYQHNYWPSNSGNPEWWDLYGPKLGGPGQAYGPR
jgi:hypothetical protein